MRAVVVASLLLAGCSKCGESPKVVDAGQPVRRSIDVRTALVYAYPEYRGTALIDTTARVTREIPGLTEASRDEALKKLKYEAASDGGAGWNLSQFHVEQVGPQALQVSVSLDADHVGHLYIAHTGLSSQEMAMYLPRDLPTGTERFELELHYSSSPEKCAALVQQAVSLLQATQQWTVLRAPEWDGGVPDEFVAEMKNDNGARVTWERARGQVHVVYSLVTYER